MSDAKVELAKNFVEFSSDTLKAALFTENTFSFSRGEKLTGNRLRKGLRVISI